MEALRELEQRLGIAHVNYCVVDFEGFKSSSATFTVESVLNKPAETVEVVENTEPVVTGRKVKKVKTEEQQESHLKQITKKLTQAAEHFGITIDQAYQTYFVLYNELSTGQVKGYRRDQLNTAIDAFLNRKVPKYSDIVNMVDDFPPKEDKYYV